jgi:hypothetical protein
MSTTTQDGRLVDVGDADYEIGASFTNPLTLQDQVVDSLDFRLPLAIKDSDLVQTSSLRGSSMPPLSRSFSTSSLPATMSQGAPGIDFPSISTQQTNIVWRLYGGADSDGRDRLQDTILLKTPTGPTAENRKTLDDPLGSADATIDIPSRFTEIQLPEPAHHVPSPAKDSVCYDGFESDHILYRSRSVANMEASTTTLSKKSSSCIVQ